MATYKKDELETGEATANATENLRLSDQDSDGFSYKAYEPSDAVKLAQQQLQTQLSQKPGAYQSEWQTQLNDTINKILNREKFSYDLNGDALYQQYKDKYVTQGKMAMMDTMGQAQAMTGGYGNSYAQAAGQQAYQGYIQQLNDKIPELWQLALSKYQMEGDQMYDQATLMAQMEDQDYGRYRDQVGDWQTEADRLQNRYDTERDYDYGQYSDDRAYAYQEGRDKVADEQWQAEFDEAKRQYDQAYALENGDSSSNNGDDDSVVDGSYDANTAKIQQELRDAGYDIAVDGIWGPETQAAYDDYKNGGKGNDDPEDVGDKLTYSDVALTAAQMRQKGASKNDIYQYISSVLNSSNYVPTNSVIQDLAELKAGYVGTGR